MVLHGGRGQTAQRRPGEPKLRGPRRELHSDGCMLSMRSTSTEVSALVDWGWL